VVGSFELVGGKEESEGQTQNNRVSSVGAAFSILME
jgi:hypothetical protein